jgi:uncharacterized phage-associated protein
MVSEFVIILKYHLKLQVFTLGRLVLKGFTLRCCKHKLNFSSNRCLICFPNFGVDMLVGLERDKMFNALIYFAENVRYAGKTKLFKLLNFLDFSHFEKTGRSVTGLQYYAWDKGPVPQTLFEEWKNPSDEFKKHNIKKKIDVGGFKRDTINPRHKFDEKLFSKYELSLIIALAKKHFNANAEDMSELSHFETGYWNEVWNDGAGSGEHIPYDLVLLRRNNSQDQQVMSKYLENLEMRKNYG